MKSSAGTRTFMCGIYGAVHFDHTSPSREQLRQGSALAAHRGPDGDGVYVCGSVGLAHRRLAIIDLSSAAGQPMLYRNSFAITYNGEIYNHIELREQLRRCGHDFNSSSDTEVVLAAFAEWGEECFSRFDGMWALAIHDRERHCVWLSCDRFGEKPLHWITSGRRLTFASEIRQLLPLLPKVRANARVLDSYLSNRAEGEPSKTFFAGVNRLAGSSMMRICERTGDLDCRHYYRMGTNPQAERLGISDAATALRDRLVRAVRLRLRSDVRVGVCLSGGLDSSSIAALAAPEYRAHFPQRMTAIHAQSSEQSTDESAFARLVARHCDLDLHVIKPGPADFCGVLDEVVLAQEEPFGGPSVVMQYLVMRRARELGCKVMLDGQGSDEALLGNERYFVTLLSGHLRARRYAEASSLLRKARLFKLTRPGLALRSCRSAFPWLFEPAVRQVRSWLRPGHCDLTAAESRNETTTTADCRSVQIMDLTSDCLPTLLRYCDRNSMRHGVETRLPFLDHSLVEFSVALPDGLKHRDGYLKYALRRAIAGDLPRQVAWRGAKFGFEAPSSSWLGASRDSMTQAILGSPLLSGRFQRQHLFLYDSGSLWRLFNVAAWERIFSISGCE